MYPNVVEAQQRAARELQDARKRNPMEKFNLDAITDKLAEMEDDEEEETMLNDEVRAVRRFHLSLWSDTRC